MTNKKINHELCILKQIKNYKEFFNSKKIKMLFKQHDESHIINLIKNKKSLFIFLYNLSQNKLTKLCHYFDDVLTKE